MIVKNDPMDAMWHFASSSDPELKKIAESLQAEEAAFYTDLAALLEKPQEERDVALRKAVRDLMEWLGPTHSATTTRAGLTLANLTEANYPGWWRKVERKRRARELRSERYDKKQKRLAAKARARLTEDELSALRRAERDED